MVLNYYPASYIGWPIPAIIISITIAKIQKIYDNTKYSAN